MGTGAARGMPGQIDEENVEVGTAQLMLSFLYQIIPRVCNRKSVQLPYGFCTRHLDSMT